MRTGDVARDVDLALMLILMMMVTTVLTMKAIDG